MLKFTIQKHLKDKRETILDLDEDGIIRLVIQEANKYLKTKPKTTPNEVKEIIYKSIRDASASFKKETVRY